MSVYNSIMPRTQTPPDRTWRGEMLAASGEPQTAHQITVIEKARRSLYVAFSSPNWSLHGNGASLCTVRIEICSYQGDRLAERPNACRVSYHKKPDCRRKLTLFKIFFCWWKSYSPSPALPHLLLLDMEEMEKWEEKSGCEVICGVSNDPRGYRIGGGRWKWIKVYSYGTLNGIKAFDTHLPCYSFFLCENTHCSIKSIMDINCRMTVRPFSWFIARAASVFSWSLCMGCMLRLERLYCKLLILTGPMIKYIRLVCFG